VLSAGFLASEPGGWAMSVRLLIGDCRDLMGAEGLFDMILADPPYGDTSLAWDRKVAGWEAVAREALKPSGSMWVFGSMRYFLAEGVPTGWRYAQDVVWEKHNGSGFHADRFKRVHEHAVQLYRDDAPWSGVFNDVQTTADATPRAVRRKKRPAHTGHIDASHYVSEDGGPRIMRSVIPMRSMHGRAIHPTEKPSALLEILIRTSCPPGGLVGDFFAGSGAGGDAASMCGRNYVGCEIDPSMAEKARARLSSNLFSGVAA
jgi:site-specific DNA-methyltransferase (adenine-specific)